uniref:WAT1-related protein n=1 Tax=Leersia perrieri TaxID=77586 RepID=A0A0D9XI08_9ORYZ
MASEETAEASSSSGGGGSSPAESVMLPASMVLVQLFCIVLVLLSKLALSTGMRPFVLLAYRNLVGAVAVAPFAFIFEWKNRKFPSIVEWVILSMGLYYYGLRSTSATYSVIFLNMIPIVTSVIAIIFRAEKLVLTNWAGKIKLFGIITCVGGTMIVRLAKVFPSRYWATTLTCLSGSLQAFVIGILISPTKSAWILKWDLQLLTVIYSLIGLRPDIMYTFHQGVFNTGVSFVLMSWAVKHRGPIYPSMFNSLSLVAMVIMDSVLFGTNIFVGSILGTSFIIVGLYAFLWGKGKELKQAAEGQNTDHKQGNIDCTEQGGDEIA